MLSLPAIFRVRETLPNCRWALWGPSDRLALLPGFAPAPPEFPRLGHTLWGESPAASLLRVLGRCRVVLAFGGRQPPAWIRLAGERGLGVASFPGARPCWVPLHQARQLDALQVPRVRRPWVRGWRRRVMPRREPHEIVFHCGSGDPKKNVPASTWAQVVRALQRQTGGPVGLVVGPAELERAGWEELRACVDRVWECSTIGDLVSVLSRARIFLGNDSGVTQLAGLLGIPTVAAFGPSDPRCWRPLGRQVRVVAAAQPCAPCSAGGPIACEDGACLHALAAETAVCAAQQLLAADRDL